MRILAAIMLVSASAALFGAPVPKELRNAGRTEGTWKLESLVTFGQPAYDPRENTHWSIAAEGTLSRHSGPTAPMVPSEQIRLGFDPRAKTVDYITPGTTFLGVYELHGDSLMICLSMQGDERPKAIGAGLRTYFWTLKRVKPEEKK